MSRWGKPRKNKKFIDPRYFMNEKVENINPTAVNVYLLRIVSGVRIEDEPPRHAWGRRKHAMWKQEEEEVDQAIAKINNGEYTEDQLGRAEKQAATIPPHFSDLEITKAGQIDLPLPEPKSKIGRMVGKLKDRFGLEETS